MRGAPERGSADRALHRALGLICGTTKARCGGDSCSPSTGEAKAGKPEVQGHLQLHSDSKAKDGGSKKGNEEGERQLAQLQSQEECRLWRGRETVRLERKLGGQRSGH